MTDLEPIKRALSAHRGKAVLTVRLPGADGRPDELYDEFYTFDIPAALDGRFVDLIEQGEQVPALATEKEAKAVRDGRGRFAKPDDMAPNRHNDFVAQHRQLMDAQAQLDAAHRLHVRREWTLDKAVRAEADTWSPETPRALRRWLNYGIGAAAVTSIRRSFARLMAERGA